MWCNSTDFNSSSEQRMESSFVSLLSPFVTEICGYPPGLMGSSGSLQIATNHWI